MKLKFDDTELSLQRTNELEVRLDTTDRLSLFLSGSEVLVAFRNGEWCIFCPEKINVTQEGKDSGISIGHSF